MVVNIAVAILAHHIMTLFFNGIFSYDIGLINHLPGPLDALYLTLFAYSISVSMLLFAAEAVNFFVRVVLVFSEIDHYVTNSRQLSLHGVSNTSCYWYYNFIYLSVYLVTPLFYHGLLYTFVYFSLDDSIL